MAVIENLDVILGAKTGPADNAIRKEIRELDRLRQHANRVDREVNSAIANRGQITTMAMRFVAPIGIGAAAKQALDLAMNVETASMAFEVLTGSAETAKTMLGEMKRMDAESPLSFVDIQEAGKTLLGFGMDSKELMGNLEALGNISLGNADRFKSFALALGQVQAAGRLTGAEVLQFINAGFNPLQAISKSTGKSMSELREEMAAGKITVEQVKQALIEATSAGGQFAGMSEKLGNTTAGSLAKMQSELQTFGVNVGNLLGYLARPVFDGTKNTLSVFNNGIGGALDKLGNADYDAKMREAAEKAEKLRESIEASAARAKEQAEAFKNSYNHITDMTIGMDKFNEQSKTQLSTQAALARMAGGDDFKAKLTEIDEAFRRMQLGEEKFRKLELEGLLKNNELSKEDKILGERALLKQAAIDEFEKEEKLREKAKQEAEQKREADKQAAEQLQKAAQTPRESFVDEIKEMSRLYQEGLIDKATLDRNVKKSVDESGMIKEPQNVGAVSAQAGSVEAYKMLLGREDERKREAAVAAQKREAMLLAMQTIAKNSEKFTGLKAAR